jgi:branched-chain amino acid transport system ATP-binding protein
MVAIGRALMAMPRLLLLDEPSLGLAPHVVDRVFEVVAGIHGDGVTVLLVEQNIVQAFAIAARAYVLEQGRIVAEGTPAVLARDARSREAYLGQQQVSSTGSASGCAARAPGSGPWRTPRG